MINFMKHLQKSEIVITKRDIHNIINKYNNKLKVKKYDPIARKHVLFEDKKLSKLKKKYKAASPEKSAAETAKK